MSEKDVKEIHAKIEALGPLEKLDLASSLWRYGKRTLAIAVVERARLQMELQAQRPEGA